LAGSLARFLFGVALLLAGLGSSITSSMAEANVLTGFLGRPEDPRSRFYRVALFILSVPALVVILAQFDSFRVLILSQVVLSVQLPFTILPLLLVAGDARIMGGFASGRLERLLGAAAGAFVVVLNALLLYQIAGGSF
jgi:manganese transport protein